MLGFGNRMEPPNTSEVRFENKHKNPETKNLWKPVFSSKVVNPYICAPRPPFIGKQRDFYILKLPLDLREYSKWKHVHICLWHLSIHGANLRYLLTCHPFTPQSWTFGATSSIQSAVSAFTCEVLLVYRFLLWKLETTTEGKFPKLRGFLKFPLQWKRQTNSQTWIPSAIISPEGIR
jgi:hypothetical protein